MRIEDVPVGSRVVDSVQLSTSGTAAQLRSLKASGIDGVVGYLGSFTRARLDDVLAADLGFMPATYAGEYRDGAVDENAQLAALAVPRGATTWLDLEGLDAWNTPVDRLGGLIEAWASGVVGAGHVAGLYVGAPQPFTGRQLYALRGITRYWLGIGRCVGKDPTARKVVTGLPDGVADAYPECGWCMRQDSHGQKNGMIWRGTGVLVDVSAVQRDHKGRLPTWVVA